MTRELPRDGDRRWFEENGGYGIYCGIHGWYDEHDWDEHEECRQRIEEDERGETHGEGVGD